MMKAIAYNLVYLAEHDLSRLGKLIKYFVN